MESAAVVFFLVRSAFSKTFSPQFSPIQSQMTALLQHPSVSRDLETELRTRVGLQAIVSSLERSLGVDKVRCVHPLLHFKTAGMLQNVNGILPPFCSFRLSLLQILSNKHFNTAMKCGFISFTSPCFPVIKLQHCSGMWLH